MSCSQNAPSLMVTSHKRGRGKLLRGCEGTIDFDIAHDAGKVERRVHFQRPCSASLPSGPAGPFVIGYVLFQFSSRSSSRGPLSPDRSYRQTRTDALDMSFGKRNMRLMSGLISARNYEPPSCELNTDIDNRCPDA